MWNDIKLIFSIIVFFNAWQKGSSALPWKITVSWGLKLSRCCCDWTKRIQANLDKVKVRQNSIIFSRSLNKVKNRVNVKAKVRVNTFWNATTASGNRIPESPLGSFDFLKTMIYHDVNLTWPDVDISATWTQCGRPWCLRPCRDTSCRQGCGTPRAPSGRWSYSPTLVWKYTQHLDK